MIGKHLFAFYATSLPRAELLTINQQICINDEALWHRLYKVLRLTQDETVILFNGFSTVIELSLITPKKGSVSGIVNSIHEVQALSPSLHLYCGLLKRDALHDVAYYAAQIGATSVTFLQTNKVQRSWDSEKDYEKLHCTMIAGCEQSKQFIVPKLYEPLALSKAIEQCDRQATSIVCDPQGFPLLNFLNDITLKKAHHINVFIGPEGGFTDNEIDTLVASCIQKYALTKTILRTHDAVLVCLGSIRALAL